MVIPKLANNKGQAVGDKIRDITLYLSRCIIHAIHVNTKNRISKRVAIEHAGGVVAADELPVLTPVSRIYHKRVLEAGVAHGNNRVLRCSNPVGRIGIPIWLIANVDNHVRFLAGQSALNACPIGNRLCQGIRTALLAIAGGVVVFKHSNKTIGFTQTNHIGHVAGAVGRPAPAT